jgi:hypothetical protein
LVPACEGSNPSAPATNISKSKRLKTSGLSPAEEHGCSTVPGSAASVAQMVSSQPAQPRTLPFLPWLVAALAGVAAPAIAILLLANAPTSSFAAGGPILAVGLMAVGMISAAASGRLWIGIALALLSGAGLILFARALGLPYFDHPLASGLALIIASSSFAARGALFARSAADKGWWVAIAVVAGEAAMLATAAARPGSLPDWLLALLPAQWASTAIQIALTGVGMAPPELLALAGTAAATLLVARLWPRKWPYLVMFSAWLGLSALVWHMPALPIPPL